MDENKRFELAGFLKELRDEKAELEDKVKSINAEIESVSAELIADLIENESTGFNYQGHNFTLVVKEYPAAEPDRKDELYGVMKEKGFGHLFTINSNTLSATVKELKANNGDTMPPWLEGLIKVAEKATIQIRKGRRAAPVGG
jgi:hypothetical protein